MPERRFAPPSSLAIFLLSMSYGIANGIKAISFRENNSVTSYEWIERTVSQYLLDEKKDDRSPVHLLLHPAADSRVVSRVLRSCLEKRQSVIRLDDKDSRTGAACSVDVTCSKVSRILAVYNNIDDINPAGWRTSYDRAWNSRSEIAIFISRLINYENSIAEVELAERLQNFWSIGCLNVVFIVMLPQRGSNGDNGTMRVNDSSIPSVDNDVVPYLFGYDPFTLKKSANGYSDKRGRLYKRDYRETLFPDKLKNLQGFPIAASVYQQEPHVILINYTKLGGGTSIDRLRYFADWMNFSVNLVGAPTLASSYTVWLPDGGKIGPIGDVIKNRSEFLVNAELIDAANGQRVEFLRPFESTYVSILVPRTAPMPGVLRIFRSIDTTIGGLILLSFVGLAIFFHIRKKSTPVMKAYRLFIYQQLNDIGDSISERIFSITWIVWAFGVCVAGQSYLIKDLTDPPIYKNIDTLEQLSSSSLTLMIDRIYTVSLNNSDSMTKKRLAMNAIDEEDFAVCTKRMIGVGDVACAMDGAYVIPAVAKLNSKLLIRSNPNWKSGRKGVSPRVKITGVHVSKEHLIESWRTVIVKEGFPYLNKFNVALDKIVESGLYLKWFKKSLAQRTYENPSSSIHYKLNMTHFEGTFKILAIGLTIASAVFLVEITFYCLKRRYNVLGKKLEAN